RVVVGVVGAQETLLDEGEQGGVVGNPVRDVVRPGERGDRDEGDAKAELIEVRAPCRVRLRGGEARADGGRVDLAHEALGSAAGLLTRRGIREVGALPG